MAPKTKIPFKGKVRDDYLDLVMKFPLTSLKSEQQFESAQAVLDELLAKEKLNAGEEMYLDALGDLVAAYEDAHYPIAPASDADMLRHLMEAKGVTQADVHQDTGLAKSPISDVLAERSPPIGSPRRKCRPTATARRRIGRGTNRRSCSG
jgi:HTH-type transcriptional regulator / antitoxin HigA